MEVVKEQDKHGRLVLPKEWREKYEKDGRILLIIEADRIVICP